MAGTSLFALIDDIATVLDDITLMTKVMTKKITGVLGTLAMFLVGGGIISHGLPFVYHISEQVISLINYPTITSLILNLLVGLLSGALCLLALSGAKKFKASIS